jgi:3-methylfumaryl-CoA hydratase
VSDDFTGWIGRSEVRRDVLAPAHALQLAAMLDASGAVGPGDPLPPLWHWIYFPPLTPQADLGADGHPPLGGFLPPVPLPRRMWAGGRLTFRGQLRLGEEVERRTTILSVTEKTGRQGRLVFLTLGHVLSNAEGAMVEEEQDIVYRAAEAGRATPAAAAAVETAPGDWRLRLVPDTRLLFRYSALTFNAHRIHYDREYASSVEGYPALVVQGPLTATLLLDRLARQTGARVATFRFRGQTPLFCGQAMALCGRAVGSEGAYSLWAEGPQGQVAMTAEATTNPEMA